MKQNKVKLLALKTLTDSLRVSHSVSYSSASATAYMTINTGQTGIAGLDQRQLLLIGTCPCFRQLRAGFQSGTLTIEFDLS